MIQNEQTKQQNQSKKPKKSDSHSEELTFLEHIYELRRRLFWIVLVLVITSAIGFQYKDQLIAVVMAPLHGEKLIYLTPGGGFSFIFTLCLYFGALLTIPVIVYHLYRFLQPLLKATSRRFVVIFVTLSSLLALTGALFGYFIAIPAAINFLTTFAGDAISPNLTADSYLNFVVVYMLGLAALFQIPLLLFLFDHIRPFPPGTLSSTQRFVIIGAVVVAALITPTPDVVNQMIVAGPIIVVYELGALVIYIRRRSSHAALAKQAKMAVAPAPPVEIINEPLTAIVEEFEKAPIITPSVAPPIALQRPRTIDGVLRTRPAPANVRVPSRAVTSAPIVRPRAPTPQNRRSIDGFLPALT